MELDPARVEDTRAWFAKAGADLRAARPLMAAERPFVEHTLFLVQQAIEKTLKGYLAWHDVPFRKTHDLATLAAACIRLDPTLQPLLDRARPFSEYAWKYRYPAQFDEPAPVEQDAADGLAFAQQVFEEVLGRLPAAVRPLP